MGRTVEIDESELLVNRQLRGVLQKMMTHPKAKRLVQEAHKLVDPTAVTPDLDADQPVNEKFATVTDELAALKKQMAEEKAEAEKAAKLGALERQVDEGLAKLRRDGWTDDGVAGVRKIMEEKGILEPEIAAAYFEKLHPPQQPATPSGSGSWDFLTVPADDEPLKQLVESKGENEGVLRKLTQDALADVRGTPRR